MPAHDESKQKDDKKNEKQDLSDARRGRGQTTEIYTLSLHDALPISYNRPAETRLIPRSYLWAC